MFGVGILHDFHFYLEKNLKIIFEGGVVGTEWTALEDAPQVPLFCGGGGASVEFSSVALVGGACGEGYLWEVGFCCIGD